MGVLVAAVVRLTVAVGTGTVVEGTAVDTVSGVRVGRGVRVGCSVAVAVGPGVAD